MGAAQFITSQVGDGVGAAFREAVDAEAYLHGHAGYTGTLAEKDEYVVIDAVPRDKASAVALARLLLHDNDPRIDDKWGPAGAIAFEDDGVKGWLFVGWASS